MSIIGALLGKVMADRYALPPDAANRYMVTGYVLGATTSPLLGAVVVDQLARRDAASQPAAPAVQPVAGARLQLPAATSGRVWVQNLEGTVFQEAELQQLMPPEVTWTKQEVPVRHSRDIGKIFNQSHYGLVPTGTRITFYVGVAAGRVEVPNLVGKTLEAAQAMLTELKDKGMNFPEPIVSELSLVETAKAQAGYVMGQEPKPGQGVLVEPEKTTLRLYVGLYEESAPADGRKEPVAAPSANQ